MNHNKGHDAFIQFKPDAEKSPTTFRYQACF